MASSSPGSPVRRWISNTTLRTQILLTAGVGTIVTGLGVILGLATHPSLRAFRTEHVAWVSPALLGGLVGVVVAATIVALIVKRLLRPLDQLHDSMAAVAGGRLDVALERMTASRDLGELTDTFRRVVEQMHKSQAEHERSREDVVARTRTVDRLLDFSQNIQGAGRSDQVIASLAHFLRHELALHAITILGHDPEQLPPTQILACWPDDLATAERPIADMDTALCPCLRQNQPRCFRPEGSNVRCTIEQCLKLPPANPAYCLPVNIGRKLQLVVHMLLPTDQPWTEERRQLAQTYVNTAQSVLTSLHLLAEAEKQSLTDSLTGLYNRRSLESLLQREVALAERHARPLSVVMIDMDLFKQINDAHGHAAGDHLLKAFADCVRMTLRTTDLAFRYGGDEFLIALPQTPIAQAQQVVQKLRQAFSAVDFSSAVANLVHQPTLSMGLAERSTSHNVLTLSALLTAADQALYEAKSASRNCIRLYEPPKAA